MMEIIVSARHMELTGSMNTMVRDNLERVGQFYNKLNRVEVVLDVNEKVREFSAVISLRGKKIELSSVAKAESMGLAINEAVERLMTRLKKKVGSLKNHHAAGSKRVPEVVGDDMSDDFYDVPSVY